MSTHYVPKTYRAVNVYSRHLAAALIFAGIALLSIFIAIGIFLQVYMGTGILRIVSIAIAILFALGGLRILWQSLQLLRTALFLVSVAVDKNGGLVINWKNGTSSVFAFDSIIDWVDSDSGIKMSLRKGMILISLSTTMFEGSAALAKELHQCITCYQPN